MNFFSYVFSYFKKDKGAVSVKEQQSQPDFMYTEEQLMARLRFFIGICLALTLTGIVFVVLYSIIFVTQPLNAISPIDQKFFELIIPIATFLTGTLSGIMLAGNDKDAKMKALDMAAGSNKPSSSSPLGSGPITPIRPMGMASTMSSPSMGMGAGTPVMPSSPMGGMSPVAEEDGVPRPVVRRPVTPRIDDV